VHPYNAISRVREKRRSERRLSLPETALVEQNHSALWSWREQNRQDRNFKHRTDSATAARKRSH
jgi:hypothetical protein